MEKLTRYNNETEKNAKNIIRFFLFLSYIDHCQNTKTEQL